MGTAREPSRLALVLAIVFAMAFPSVMTWFYFLALAPNDLSFRAQPAERETINRAQQLQQFAYVSGKAVQFSFPLLFVWITSGRFPWPRRISTAGVGLGLAFGLLVVGLMVVVYFGFLRHSAVLADTPLKLRRKLEEFGADAPGPFLALGVFIAAIHSLMEEYYWRWFVFGRLRELVAIKIAIVVSSLGFMAHHVILLNAYLPGQFWTGVIPFSLGVAVGGAFWAWLYQRSGTLLGPWLSHLLADTGLFVVGWDMLFATARTGIPGAG